MGSCHLSMGDPGKINDAYFRNVDAVIEKVERAG